MTTKIADKIRKLIAKADSSTHPEESAAFMAKVHGLLESHGLSNCEALIANCGNKRFVTIIGRESARVTFAVMFPYIRRCISASARELVKTQGSTYSKQHGYVARALGLRLDGMYFDRKRERAEYAKTGVNALVPVDIIKAYSEEKFNPGKARPSSYLTTLSAMAAAKDINVDQQVDGAKGAKALTK